MFILVEDQFYALHPNHLVHQGDKIDHKVRIILDLKALQTMSIFCLTYLRLVCFFLGVVMALFVPDPSEAVDNRCAK